jgi:hypothetical protein
MEFQRRAAPPLVHVQQKLPHDHIADVRKETAKRLLDAGLKEKVRPGHRVAITAGSRGIGGFIELLSGTVDAVKACQGEPFIIPGMGSHGGATPEGQIELLQRLGVREQSVGAPVRATMDTLALGSAKNGAVAHLDKFAAAADGIIVLGRVATHPESASGIASGLLKMVTVGLGKQAGAQQAHSHGLWKSVKEVPRLTLAKSKILCGVAVVENAFQQPAEIEIVPADYEAFRQADHRLLGRAKELKATLPIDELDLLIVDEVGKNIAGTGMDLNVIGNWRATGHDPHSPNYKRIAALSLTSPSLGNGLGIGMADFTTERFMHEYDPAVTYVNLLTAQEPDGSTREGPLPLALPTDREAIEVALYSSLAEDEPRVCRIKSTRELSEFWVSAPLVEHVRKNSQLEVLGSPEPLAFDHAGNLF